MLRTYERRFAQFTNFVKTTLGTSNPFPAHVRSVYSFIAHLFSLGYAPSTITSYLSAVAYFHKINDHPDPTSSFLIKKMVQGARKMRPTADIRAPITPSILHRLVESTSRTTDSYYNRLLISAMYLLAFHAFLRIGEIAVSSPSRIADVIQLSQVSLSDTLCITFKKYKHHSGPPVVIAVPKHSGLFCPVQALANYLSFRSSQPGPLFMFPDGAPVSKSFFQKNLSLSLSFLNINSKTFKGHSFRIGAATTAAIQGQSEEQIQRMGRWKSDAFKKCIRIPVIRFA